MKLKACSILTNASKTVSPFQLANSDYHDYVNQKSSIQNYKL